MIQQRFVFLTLLFIFPFTLFAEDHKYLKAFPEAQGGYTRFVLELPHKERGEDKNFKVELVAGKTIETDGVNKLSMATEIKPQPLKGWGFTYYDVTGSDLVRSTMMASAPNAPKVTRFIGGTPLTIHYNSRVPIVIYAPEGFEIRYRIWEAPLEFIPLEK